MKLRKLWLIKKAEFMKKHCPQKAIAEYCLKNNRYAKFYLPGVKEELSFLDKYKDDAYALRKAITERIWSDETRKVLYARGMWVFMEVKNRWEFEYLLKNTQPIIWLSDVNGACRTTPALGKIKQMLLADEENVILLGNSYPKIVENIGAKILHNWLSPKMFDTLVDILCRKNAKYVLPFAKFYSLDSQKFREIFLFSLWTHEVDLTPVLADVCFSNQELFRHFYGQQSSYPTNLGLKAMFCDVLPKLIDNDGFCGAEDMYRKWLKLLEKYAQRKNVDLWFLQTAYAKLKMRHNKEILQEFVAVVNKIAPNVITPFNMVHGKH